MSIPKTPFRFSCEAYHDGSGIFIEGNVTSKDSILGVRYTITSETKGHECKSEVGKHEMELLIEQYTIIK